jgi:hypothetical protein
LNAPPKKVKFSTCRYCQRSDLVWEVHEGKYIMFESYGLPHQCEKRDQILAEQQEAKKKQYAEYKAKVETMPIGPCPDCKGSGMQLMVVHSSPSHLDCNTCWGQRKITEQLKKNMLYRKRVEIWPGIQNNRKQWRK